MKSLHLLLVCGLIILSSPIVSFAQGLGTLRGVTFNEEGQPLANAQIILSDAKGNILRMAHSNQDGVYQIVGLFVKTYDVRARVETLENVCSVVVGDVIIASHKATQLDLMLVEDNHCDHYLVAYEPPLISRDPFAPVTWFALPQRRSWPSSSITFK